MTETWLPWCVRRPGPPEKQGYPSAPSRTLDQIEGEVKHSTEGSLLAAFGELDNPARRASWTFTVDTGGTVYQHYPLESITWHCGVLGDRSQDTALVGNLTLVGIEHVDRVGRVQLDTLTPAETAATKRITEDLRRLCFLVAANPPALRLNEWEHGWLSQTACPSGLIPWGLILEEDDMTPEEHLWLQETHANAAATNQRTAWLLGELPGQTETGIETLVKRAGGAVGASPQAIADEIAKRMKD